MMLPVFAGGARVGDIITGQNGPSFRYNPAWARSGSAFPVSLSMPLSQEAWSADIATPWLMNLLPEGEPLRAMSRALGVAGEDVAAHIAASGRDLAGALSFREIGEDQGYVPVGDSAALERIINALPARPFLVGEEGGAISLAGAQDKLPVRYSQGAFSIPVNEAASTHILKPDNPRLPGSVQNEALCMVLARRCGLPVAGITTGTAGARSYLPVTRHDRVTGKDGVQRRHQEDFCQALGRVPVAKYQHNGTGRQGPSLTDMVAVIREHMTARDTNQFLDAVIFNIAIGNVDSHAKTYSILLEPGRTRLAPLYDLMTGLAWAGITENHAQDVGGQRRGRYIYARHWRRMAEDAGLSALAVVRRVSAISDRIVADLPAACEEVASVPGGAGGMLDEFAHQIERRARTVSTNSREDSDLQPPDEVSPETGRYDA